MYEKPLLRFPSLSIFLVLFAVAIGWAFYTQHAWEDYYITYRASKNLATGYGLTFTAGERVHSFTSPLGVLLPALASLLTGNRSDQGALWIFRIFSCAAFAGAGLLLWQCVHRLGWTRFAAILAIALFVSDTKIVDFSTNGMETGFVLLFLSWTLFVLLAPPPRLTLHLGLAWAGLMWTRPDSFVYIGATAVAALLFSPDKAAVGGRLKLIKAYVSAGTITTVMYVPWLLWATVYYGSPIPNTIIAKGLFQPPTTLSSLWSALLNFPAKMLHQRDILTTTFMPPYSFNTGWPATALHASYWLSVAVMTVWILPGIRREARIASFTFFVGQFYLSTYVNFPVPWYIPTLTFLAVLTLGSVFNQFISRGEYPVARLRSAVLSRFLRAIGVTLCLGSTTMFCLAAYQLRWQQELIEIGQRKEIGTWLRAQASSSDESVFLEPLGYIGYFSNLKMLDYPGLSSPEVIAARKRASSTSYPDCWPELIMDLTPNWVVLRPYEADVLRKSSSDDFERFYTLARTFDVRARVEAVPHLLGRGYLLNDALFEVYRRKPMHFQSSASNVGIRAITTKQLAVNESWGRAAYDSGPNLVAHAPARLVFNKPAGAEWLTGGFGFFDGAYENSQNGTDGAEFSITLVSAHGARERLWSRALNPRDNTAERGRQAFAVKLPRDVSGTLEIAIAPGSYGSNAFDWTYWTDLMLEFPH